MNITKKTEKEIHDYYQGQEAHFGDRMADIYSKLLLIRQQLENKDIKEAKRLLKELIYEAKKD